MTCDHGIRLTVERLNNCQQSNIGGDVLAEFVPHHPADGHGIGVELVGVPCEEKLKVNWLIKHR